MTPPGNVDECGQNLIGGPVTVYRLNGTKPAEKFRTWVDFGRELVLPAPKIEERQPLGTKVLWLARATPHVLEVSTLPTKWKGIRSVSSAATR